MRIPLLISLLAAVVAAGDAPRNVILFGWDGAQREHVEQCLARGELPVLDRMRRDGSYTHIDIVGATDTKAGWTQILTGYMPETTGVYSNRRYRPIPAGLSVFERLERRFGPEGFATLAVIGKKGNVDADPPRRIRLDDRPASKRARKQKRKRRPEGEIVVENGVRYRVVPGKPWHEVAPHLDLFENGLKLDEAVGKRAMEVIERHRDKRFFLFVHFAEVDHAGHKHGENSHEYNDALVSNDRWTGRILERVAELGLADRTWAFVTADHGFDEGKKSHRNAPYVFLACTRPGVLVRDGYRQDVAATILAAFGLDPAAYEPPLAGRPLSASNSRGRETRPATGSPR